MNEITDQDVAEANELYRQWGVAITANPAMLRELTDKFYVAHKQYCAVPVDSIAKLMDAFETEGYPFGYLLERNAVAEWLSKQQAVR